MKKKTVSEYTLHTNGMPDYTKIPNATLEPIAKKFLENILKKLKDKKSGD